MQSIPYVFLGMDLLLHNLRLKHLFNIIYLFIYFFRFSFSSICTYLAFYCLNSKRIKNNYLCIIIIFLFEGNMSLYRSPPQRNFNLCFGNKDTALTTFTPFTPVICPLAVAGFHVVFQFADAVYTWIVKTALFYI